MDSFLSIFVLIGILSTSYSEDVQYEENRGIMPVAVIPAEENEPDIKGSSDSVLSSKKLSELHDLAKNISHSKGIYREAIKSGNEEEIRRSILKKAAVVSESDTMRTILKAFESYENKTKLQLLAHMEFLVHQYDVAVNFAASGGLKIIAPYLFSSSDEVVASVASVLGAAMASNPTVQNFAINQGIGEMLLELLNHKSPHVLSRVIFALASLLRNTPKAQEKFLCSNGFSKFADILQNSHIATNTKLKIINLFNDLAVEQETVENYPDARSSEEINYLKRLFVSEMQKYGVCELIPLFLNLEDFDTHQKIITAMISLHNTCQNYFKKDNINNRLKKLLKIYDPYIVERDPLYPVIDEDLRQALYVELKDLIKKTEPDSKSFDSLSKTEL